MLNRILLIRNIQYWLPDMDYNSESLYLVTLLTERNWYTLWPSCICQVWISQSDCKQCKELFNRNQFSSLHWIGSFLISQFLKKLLVREVAYRTMFLFCRLLRTTQLANTLPLSSFDLYRAPKFNISCLVLTCNDPPYPTRILWFSRFHEQIRCFPLAVYLLKKQLCTKQQRRHWLSHSNK